MKTESQIIDEVYENQVYRLCTVLLEAYALNVDLFGAESKFQFGIKKYRNIRDRAKALLKEVDDG